MLGKHPRAALQFSGGKDSLAMLHLARPCLERIEVFFVDTGSTYPHVIDFVYKTCRELEADLIVVKPDMPVLKYHEEAGLPADIVPLDSLDLMQELTRHPGQRLQSWPRCCRRMIWEPLDQSIRKHGHTLVLRGSKACDPHRTVPPGTVHEGVEYHSPLWDWSDADVLDYLSDKEVPAQYRHGINDSMDCWCCTALLTGKYARRKLEFAQEQYPDLWPVMRDRLRLMQRTVAEQTTIVNDVIDQVTHA